MSVKKRSKIAKILDQISGISNLHYDEKNNKLFFIKVNPSYKKNRYIKSIIEYSDKNTEEIYKFKKNEKFLGFYKDKFLISKKDKLYISKIKNNAKKSELLSYKNDIKKIISITKNNIIFVSSTDTNEKLTYKYVKDIDFYSNDEEFVKKSNLVKYDISNKTFEKISDSKEIIIDVFFDENIRKILYISKEEGKDYYSYPKLKEYDMDSGIVKTIYSREDFDFEKVFYIKGEIIALGSFNRKYGVNENPEFYIVKENELSKYVDNINSTDNTINSDVRHIENGAYKVIDDTLYFLSTNGDRCKISALQDKMLIKIYDKLSSVEDFVIARDKLYISGFDKGRLEEIYLYENRENTLLTNINKKLDFDIHNFKYKFEDYELDGYVLYPKDFDTNKKYPAILEVHGGPKTAYSNNFIYEMYLLAQNGYIVFYTNPVGSDNFDNDFADIRGKYGGKDYENLKVFFENVIEKVPQIDIYRLGITGGSYGGFMTNWITSHTEIFKAAITQRCISNFVSFYATSDIGYYFAEDQLGSKGFDREKFWEHSPLKYVKNVKTPTLILHSDKDYRCPLEQGIQWYKHLKLNNCDTEMLIFKGDNHNLSRTGTVKNRVERLYQILRWFDKYLK